MPRVKAVDPPVRLHINLRTSTLAAVDMQLYSTLEGRVPAGERSKLFEELATKWLAERVGLVEKETEA